MEPDKSEKEKGGMIMQDESDKPSVRSNSNELDAFDTDQNEFRISYSDLLNNLSISERLERMTPRDTIKVDKTPKSVDEIHSRRRPTYRCIYCHTTSRFYPNYLKCDNCETIFCKGCYYRKKLHVQILFGKEIKVISRCDLCKSEPCKITSDEIRHFMKMIIKNDYDTDTDSYETESSSYSGTSSTSDIESNNIGCSITSSVSSSSSSSSSGSDSE